ncbi:SGNH/GDSL hydrolase family protein [Bdellovibrio sp. SKB1291214]|uniref:SGNH/GDSL hydrolase family protein n=1 Tax=Bdellovibrio sp. SKB1291214 TaxID=1732569 RepID=UPI000B51B914|nr:SGNH/GDSL hydrolase family protein [Bdellovibrio sp. SKB1291214]UYL07535.1 SGNH/GDSL hydrolase family protein [Bdellovibrio sp. SKB1291214]
MKKYLITTILFFISSSGFAINTVFVGDSHAYGQFGNEIDSYLRKVSKNVTTIASCGSSPSTWMAEDTSKATNCGYWRKDVKNKELRVKDHMGDSFAKEVKALHPDLTVIALGTNMLGSPSTVQNEKQYIKAMLDTVKKNNSECIWIGPPAASKDPYKLNLAQGVKEIKELAEKSDCAFIDSTTLTQNPSGQSDGIHFSDQDSKKWGAKVVAKMRKLPQVSRAREKSVQPVMDPSESDAADASNIR